MKFKLILIVLFLIIVSIVTANWYQIQDEDIEITVLEPFDQTQFNITLNNSVNQVNLNIENYASVDYDVNLTFIPLENLIIDIPKIITILQGNNTFTLDYSLSQENLSITFNVERL